MSKLLENEQIAAEWATSPRPADSLDSSGRFVLHGVNLLPGRGQDALVSLAQVSERLHALGDPRAIFPEVYGVITKRVLIETRKARPGFLEPDWIDRLMGRFCARYLETLAWSLLGQPQDCEAWRLTYVYANAGLTIPMQDVLFGISAHINYDLAQGISQTIREHGHARDPVMRARYKHDHDFVNELLRESLPECIARVRDRYGCRTTAVLWRTAAPLVARAFLGALGVWREHVWGDVERLLDAASSDEHRAVLRAMNRRSGRIGQAIAGLSAGWLLGRAVLPPGPWRALRDRFVAAYAEGSFRRLADLGGVTGPEALAS